MRYLRKFKDDHIVVFDGETFDLDGKTYEIHGVTGVDVDENTVQVRDDLWIGHAGLCRPLSFNILCQLWHRIEPLLIRIVKRKTIISRGTAA